MFILAEDCCERQSLYLEVNFSDGFEDGVGRECGVCIDRLAEYLGDRDVPHHIWNDFYDIEKNLAKLW
jgi:2-hydroxy-3-keto-5-methylthiopentenyl-1-phosphate phosphatase